MSEPKQPPAVILVHIARQLRVSIQSLLATLQLLEEGGTVPFIARYRKEATGNLDEVAIGAIQDKIEYFREMEDRRRTILSSIQEQGKLTTELQAKIESVLDRNELEDLYLSYKPKRRTKATIARECGLEIKVKVLTADAKAKRIALSIKALQAGDLPKVKHAPRPTLSGHVPSMKDKLAQLQGRFRRK